MGYGNKHQTDSESTELGQKTRLTSVYRCFINGYDAYTPYSYKPSGSLLTPTLIYIYLESAPNHDDDFELSAQEKLPFALLASEWIAVPEAYKPKPHCRAC